MCHQAVMAMSKMGSRQREVPQALETTVSTAESVSQANIEAATFEYHEVTASCVWYTPDSRC